MSKPVIGASSGQWSSPPAESAEAIRRTCATRAAIAYFVLAGWGCGGRESGSAISGSISASARSISSGVTMSGKDDGPTTGSVLSAGSGVSTVSTGTATGTGDDFAPSPDGSITPDAAALAPGCQSGGPGVANCGASGENCCTSQTVTGGTYDRTYSLNADGGLSIGNAAATVSSFRLDKYEVTVGRFRTFVTSWIAGWRPAPGSGKHTHLNGGLGLSDADSPGAYELGWIADDDGMILTIGSLIGGT